MDRLRFSHRQVENFLNDERKFLTGLSDELPHLSDHELRTQIKDRIAAIDDVFVKKRIVKNKICTDNCHFVKNGTFKRGMSRIQSNICTRCGTLKPANKLRIGLDGYLKLRLVQLKLEGVPTKSISKLLSMSTTNLNYHWQFLSEKTLQELIETDWATDFLMHLGKARSWKEFVADLPSYELYRVEFPIDNTRKLTVTREYRPEDLKDVKQVRLAQEILMTRFDYEPTGPDEESITNKILETKIKSLVRMARVREDDITISETADTTNISNRRRVQFNIRFKVIG